MFLLIGIALLLYYATCILIKNNNNINKIENDIDNLKLQFNIYKNDFVNINTKLNKITNTINEIEYIVDNENNIIHNKIDKLEKNQTNTDMIEDINYVKKLYEINMNTTNNNFNQMYDDMTNKINNCKMDITNLRLEYLADSMVNK
jgi:predicted  nucleic acid-binding Zn-ribbon protein